MSAAEWYYIGHYGQLGPLDREQIDELIEANVIESDTYVWRTGMSDWLPADKVAELQMSFRQVPTFAPPPPPPASRPPVSAPTATPTMFQLPQGSQMPAVINVNVQPFSGVKSDKSRVLAGILQLIPPGGLGRMYLGYSAIGVLQFFMFWCAFVGYVWSIIDGIIILTGGTNRDGYGRVLPD